MGRGVVQDNIIYEKPLADVIEQNIETFSLSNIESLYSTTGALKGCCGKVFFLERDESTISIADKIHPSCDEIARKMCVRLSSITIKQQRARAH